MYEDEEEATQRVWIGCDWPGCVGGGTTTGVQVSPGNLGGIRSLYVKSAHLDAATMQHCTYVLILSYS